MSTPATLQSFSLTVPGEPRGQARPRAARTGAGVRLYTDTKTTSALQRVQLAWIDAGRPVLEEGPIFLKVVAYMQRPAGHFRRNGQLSAAGVRSTHPTKKPDASNILKLIEDALTPVGAWRDDSWVVNASVSKVWVLPLAGEAPCVCVDARVKRPGSAEAAEEGA